MYCFDHELNDINWDALFPAAVTIGEMLCWGSSWRWDLAWRVRSCSWDAPAPLWSTAEARTCTVLGKGEALPLQEYGFSKRPNHPFHALIHSSFLLHHSVSGAGRCAYFLFPFGELIYITLSSSLVKFIILIHKSLWCLIWLREDFSSTLQFY